MYMLNFSIYNYLNKIHILYRKFYVYSFFNAYSFALS